MANKTITYDSADWKLWVNKPTSTDFVLDISKLDGPNTLGVSGTEAGTWGYLDADIAELVISAGTDVSAFSVPAIVPPTMTATLQFKNWTTNDLRNLVIGKQIHVTYKNAQSVDKDTKYGLNSPYFFGYINDVQVSLVPGDVYTTVNISAVSSFQNVLNYQKTLTRDTGQAKNDFFDINLPSFSPDSFINYYTVVRSDFTFATTTTDTKTYGEWLGEYLSNELTIPRFYFLVNANSSGSIFWNQYMGIDIYSNTMTTPAVTFSENDIIACQTGFVGANGPTSVTLSLESNSAIKYQANFANQNNYSFQKQLNLYSSTMDVGNSTQLALIGERMTKIDQALSVTSVDVITATKDQPIEIKEQSVNVGGVGTSYWLFPKQLVNIGSTVTIDMSDYGLESRVLQVSGRTITITPDNWITTYSLWKGYTI